MHKAVVARCFLMFVLLVLLFVPGSPPRVSSAAAAALPGGDGEALPEESAQPLPAWAVPSATWTREQIYYNSEDYPGDQTQVSLQLDSSDSPHVLLTLIDVPGFAVGYARRDGATWQISVLDTGTSPDFLGLDLDSGDSPHAVYVAADGHVRYARLSGSQWLTETVAAGVRPALALDSGDVPHVVYWDQAAQTLVHATRDGAGWTSEVVGPAVTDPYPSLAMDAQDHLRLCYSGSNGKLIYAAFDGSSWQQELIAGDDGVPRDNCSLALDGSGNPQVAFHLDIGGLIGDLNYAKRETDGWSVESLELYSVDGGSGLLVDSAGLPHISYGLNATDYAGVYYQYYDGQAWQKEYVDTGIFIFDSSLAFDSAGQPVIVDYRRPWTWVECFFHTRTPDNGTLSGRVFQPAPTGILPVPEASVTAGEFPPAWTDTNGDYALDLTAGTYDVTFAKPDYITITKTNVLVNENEVTTVNVPLIPTECWNTNQVCTNELVNLIPILGIPSEVSGFLNSLCTFTDRRANGDDLGALTALLPGLVDIVDIPGLADALDVLEGFVTCLEGVLYDALEAICGPDAASICQQMFSRSLWRIATGGRSDVLIVLLKMLPDGDTASPSSSPNLLDAVEVHVYGPGGHLGLVDGHVEHTLPTSYLFRAGGAYQLAILEGVTGPDELEIHGLSAGSYRLILVNPQSDGTGSLVTYESVPTAAGAVASITLDPDTTDFTLALDQDGDGTIDDYQPPDTVETVMPFAVYLPLVVRH